MLKKIDDDEDDGNEDDDDEDDGDEDDGDEDSSTLMPKEAQKYVMPPLQPVVQAQLPVQIPQPINTFLKYPITFERDFKLFI